jgi:dTDP-glucose pyrophosphorylase
MIEPILRRNASLRDAVELLERSRRLIVAVCDDDGRLLGVMSDGDVRRALLAGKALDSPAADAMSRHPIVGSASASLDEIRHLMRVRGVAAIPLVDEAFRFSRVVTALDADEEAPHHGGEAYSAAVIMAGGEGRRLRPLTNDRPKPMIEIGGVPLLERQVRAMARAGLRRIYIATNYLGHMIEEHFGDGSAFGVPISYLREDEKLGTAGALSLLPEQPAGPLLVVNGDVLTTCDFGRLLAYHGEAQASVTVAAIVYRVDIPFGVLRLEEARVRGIEEKPSESFLCNAGMYVLGPDALSLVPASREFNMTDLIHAALAEGRPVTAFPIHEYWSDIGSPGDLDRALKVFAQDGEP